MDIAQLILDIDIGRIAMRFKFYTLSYFVVEGLSILRDHQKYGAYQDSFLSPCVKREGWEQIHF